MLCIICEIKVLTLGLKVTNLSWLVNQNYIPSLEPGAEN